MFFYILDKFLAALQHKSEFELAVKIGQFFQKFTITENSRLLIMSRIAFIYIYIDPALSFNKLEYLTSIFINKDITKYSRKKQLLIGKIFDMYAVVLQNYKKNYSKSIEMDKKALQICQNTNDINRIFHVYIHLISAINNGNIQVKENKVDKLFNFIKNNCKDNRVIFCAYIEVIKYYADTDIYKFLLAENELDDMIVKYNLKNKYPNEERIYKDLFF